MKFHYAFFAGHGVNLTRERICIPADGKLVIDLVRPQHASTNR